MTNLWEDDTEDDASDLDNLDVEELMDYPGISIPDDGSDGGDEEVDSEDDAELSELGEWAIYAPLE